MNIAIGNKTFGRNSRFAFGLLIAGLAVAAVSLGIWQATDPGSTLTVVEPVAAPASRAQAPASSGFVPAVVPAQATIYIVGSEAQRQQLLHEASEAAAVEGGVNELPNVIVIAPSGPGALQLQEAITEDKLNGGIGANVIDLR